MIGLDFSTVAIFSSLLVSALGLVMAFSIGSVAREKGWALCIAGALLIALAGMTQAFVHESLRSRVFWISIFIALSILGFAFIFSGMRSILGIGMHFSWNFSIALVNALALVLSMEWFPGLHGLRTVAYSASSMLLVLPAIVADLRQPPRYRHLRLYDALFSLFVLLSALRLAFALLDLRRDDFIPGQADAWLCLALAASGIAALSVFLVIVVGERRPKGIVYRDPGKPGLSLSGRGLSVTECRYATAILAGRSVKDVATERGVAESTVRNTMAHVYRKLGVSDLVSLTALAGKFEILP